MSIESLTTPEKEPIVSIAPPAVESLLNPQSLYNFWPTEILTNPTLHEAAEMRNHTREAVVRCATQIEDVTKSIESALSDGDINESTVTNLYSSLTTFFEADPYNNRLALYLPFEWLPKNDTMYTSEDCQEAANKFTASYRKAWQELLHIHDLHANFVDGDIPEEISRTEPLSRTVVATKLIPRLVERGIIAADEVLSLLKYTDDQILREGVGEALSVLADKQLLNEKALKELTDSDDTFLRETANLILAEQQEQVKGLSGGTVDDLAQFFATTSVVLKEGQARYEQPKDNLTDARRTWLSQENIQRILSKRANLLANALDKGTVDTAQLIEYLQVNDNSDSARTTALAIQSLCDNKPSENQEYLQTEVRERYLPLLSSLLLHSDNAVRNDAENALLHLKATKLITPETLTDLGIKPPTLNAPFEERIHDIEKDVHTIGSTLATLETAHPELNSYIYPAAVLLGSRTKGYAKENSDLDVAVYVRPGITVDQTRLQELLKDAFPNEVVSGAVMTFRLFEDSNNLWIQNGEDTEDRTLGTTVDAHPLRGVWCGDKAAIKELHEKLLPEYLYSKDKTLYGEDARQVWLEELERDTLQYRLMHKGYDRLYPKRGRLNTPHSDAMDGQSTFYDSGYRRLATQLYIDRVFLPQLEGPSE